MAIDKISKENHPPFWEGPIEDQNQEVFLPILSKKQVSLSLKREDLIHPLISGNKFRKLKYNLLEAKKRHFDTLLTFGGAYSNHIVATAYAAKKEGFRSIGVIRGEELSSTWKTNPTLQMASEEGMRFKFISRDAYRNKQNPSSLKKLREEFGSFYTLPEGGTNALAVQGCEEILGPRDAHFDVICCPVGTGGTLAGISNAALEKQRVLGFPVLKGDFLREDIRRFALRDNWELITDYHFGGYAKVTAELVEFVNGFKEQGQISLDPVYTGKMVYGILDMIERDRFPRGTKVLAIHTGGLQGIAGMNLLLKKKHLLLR